MLVSATKNFKAGQQQTQSDMYDTLIRMHELDITAYNLGICNSNDISKLLHNYTRVGAE